MSYEIPESIHANFEIVEKMILGKKHFGLKRIFKIGKFSIPRMLKVYDCPFVDGRIDSRFGKTWHTNVKVIKAAIRKDRSDRIDNYIDKHVN